MKKLALVLTLALVLAFAAPVFANPFSDVPADHWAYEAINKLADDGVITGNPDGTYTGNKTMTRYELAVVVAKAMAAAEANSDKVSAEDKATIDKLAAEFGSELNALGVKVAALEKKVGNVKFTGDSRLRYVGSTLKIDDASPNKVNDVHVSDYQLRVRFTATATVNDQVNVSARLRTDSDYSLSSSLSNGDNDATKTKNNIVTDNFYIQYSPKKDVTIKAGHQDLKLGRTLLVADDSIKGIVATAPVGKVNVTLLNGRLDTDTLQKDKRAKDSNGNNIGVKSSMWDSGNILGNGIAATDKIDLTGIQVDNIKLFDKMTLGADYIVMKDINCDTFNGDSKELRTGAINFGYDITKQYTLYGEFSKNNAKATNNREITNAQKSASIIGLKAKNVLPKTTMDLSFGQFGAYSVNAKLTTYRDMLNTTLTNGNANPDKVNLVRFRVDYALLPGTNLYADLTRAEYKTTDNLKDKFDRIETGLEFKF